MPGGEKVAVKVTTLAKDVTTLVTNVSMAMHVRNIYICGEYILRKLHPLESFKNAEYQFPNEILTGVCKLKMICVCMFVQILKCICKHCKKINLLVAQVPE